MSDITRTDSAQTTGDTLADWLIGRIRFYDQVDPETVALDTPLTDLGLDSIYVLTLCGDIEDAYGFAIDPTFFAQYATLGELADGLTPRLTAR